MKIQSKILQAIFPGLFSVLAASVAAAAATLPHMEKLAPGVYAAGFADRYGSANCGWVALGDQTLMVDTPHGVSVAEFLSEVERTTGKPVRTLVRTRVDPSDEGWVESLRTRNVRVLDVAAERQSIGDATVGVEVIPYGKVTGGAGAAVFLQESKILFAGPASVNGPRARLPGSDMEGWITALTMLQKLPAERVVPGFGSWGGAVLLERQRLLFAELRRQVAYNIAMGIPLARIEKEILIPATFFAWMPYDTPTAEDIRWLHREMTVPRAPYFDHPPSKADGKPHALVLIGDKPHEPGHLEAGLRPVFEATGVTPHFLFDYRGLTAENLSHVSLLVVLRDGFIFPDGKGRGWMTEEQQRAVVQFVEGGGAFLNLHNSMGLYPDAGPYLRLVGGRYIGHGPLERFRTEVVDPGHPVTRGVTDFFCADEQHTPPYETNKVHLLLRNRSEDGKVVAAAGWAYEPGKGRLCHLANGHTRDALHHPMYQRLMQNAVLWCLRRD